MARWPVVAMAWLSAGCVDAPDPVDSALAALARQADERLLVDLGENGTVVATSTSARATWHVDDGAGRRSFSIESSAETAYADGGMGLVADVWLQFPEERGGRTHVRNSYSCDPQRIAMSTEVDGVRKDLEEPTQGSCYAPDNTILLIHMGGLGDLGLASGSSVVGRPADPATLRTDGSLQDAWVTERFHFEPAGGPFAYRGRAVSHIIDARISEWSLEAEILTVGDEGSIIGAAQASTSITYGERTPLP